MSRLGQSLTERRLQVEIWIPWYVLSTTLLSSPTEEFEGIEPHVRGFANLQFRKYLTRQRQLSITESITSHSVPIPPCEELLTLPLFDWIRNILKIINNSVIHLVEVHAVVFDTPGWRIRECKGKLRSCENCVWCHRHAVPVPRRRQQPVEWRESWLD